MPERRDLLLVKGGAGGDREMKSTPRHGAAAFVTGRSATGARGHLAGAIGAGVWGKRYAIPTYPDPRRLLRNNV